MTKLCPNCQTANRENSRFCVQCGFVLQNALPPVKKPTPSPPQNNPYKTPLPSSPKRPSRARSFRPILILTGAIGGIVLLIGCSILLGFALRSYGNPTPTPTIQPTVVIPGTTIEMPMVTDEQEIEIGREIDKKVREEYNVDDSSEEQKHIEQIGRTLIGFSDRPNLPYHFTILETNEINAFAAPGGYIYVSRGMVDFIQSDDELAGVLAHEISHIGRRHSAKQIEAITAAQLVAEQIKEQNEQLARIYEEEITVIATKAVAQILLTGWGREQELEADQYAVIYMTKAGYPPQALIDLFERMDNSFGSEEGGPAERLFATHPPFPDRIARIKETMDS